MGNLLEICCFFTYTMNSCLSEDDPTYEGVLKDLQIFPRRLGIRHYIVGHIAWKYSWGSSWIRNLIFNKVKQTNTKAHTMCTLYSGELNKLTET
ncbi:hypothetical protein DPMN_114701 [Dreissena polymorpha]|uniref:Uncharacterized protein n=1 Tax=Dreissena polymorpha TaxID=45954 RepID=A0A9D4KL47_DREPO|nr:hypothetical protein DPMN_114701 [Dreissena polymorpha]